MMSDDTDLIEAAKQGDNEAFDRLWARHRDKVFPLAAARLRGQPRHDARCAARRAAERFQGAAAVFAATPTSPHGSIPSRGGCASAPDAILDRFYSLDDPLNAEEGQAILRQLIDQHAQDPEALVIENDLRERVQQAIAELPDSLRPVLVLRDIEELSTEETAQRLGITQAAVKARLHRARELLRQKLEAYLHEP
jgi:RNA polymerase sigma factor (sigma-70 family)